MNDILRAVSLDAESDLPVASASPQPCEYESIIRAWIESESGPGGPWADKDPKAGLHCLTLDGDFDLVSLANAIKTAERERCAKIADGTARNDSLLSDWDHCSHIIAAKIRGSK